MGNNLGTEGSLGVFPAPSDHGDVHTLHVMRTNGDSMTLEEYRRVFGAVVGRDLTEREINMDRDKFAPEDR